MYDEPQRIPQVQPKQTLPAQETGLDRIFSELPPKERIYLLERARDDVFLWRAEVKDEKLWLAIEAILPLLLILVPLMLYGRDVSTWFIGHSANLLIITLLIPALLIPTLILVFVLGVATSKLHLKWMYLNCELGELIREEGERGEIQPS